MFTAVADTILASVDKLNENGDPAHPRNDDVPSSYLE